ncbi:MAG: endonuclease III [Luteitalea sp.]
MPRSRAVAPLALPSALAVLDRLLRHYPSPDTELVYRNAFELLVATVLSAQSTDRRVNETTPALFARYPDAATLATAALDDVEALVRPTGFFRVKARAIITLSHQLVQDHGGAVPGDMDALTALPGVGRKTANVVLGHALGAPGLPVDRHVLRVAKRIGLTRETTPEAVERDLCGVLPPEQWTAMSDGLILHGRRICRPRPLCPQCEVRDICRYPFKTAGRAALDLDAPAAGAPTRRRKAGVPIVEASRTPAPDKSGAYVSRTTKADRRAPKAESRTPNAARRSSSAVGARKRGRR